MSELKPCPFCGGAPKCWNGGTGIIECIKCSASIEGHGDEWNARAQSPAPAGEWIKCHVCGKLMPQTNVPAEKAWCSDECVRADVPFAAARKVDEDYPGKLREDIMMSLANFTVLHSEENEPFSFDDDNIWDCTDEILKDIRPYLATEARVKGLVEALDIGRVFALRYAHLQGAAQVLTILTEAKAKCLAQWSGKTG